MNARHRRIMWGFAGTLATVLIVQVYAIRELLAAFALFAVACAAIALVFFAAFMLDWLTEITVLGFQRAVHASVTWTHNALTACDAFGHRLSVAHRINHVVPAVSRIRRYSARGGSL